MLTPRLLHKKKILTNIGISKQIVPKRKQTISY